MRLRCVSIYITLFCCIAWGSSYSQSNKNYLKLVQDTSKDSYSYVNRQGDTIIPSGKYSMCFTEKFYDFAIVQKAGYGIIGIDRDEKILFKVFIFDNGPDEPSNGLFRIIKDDKIGYSELHGKIVIKPQFDGATPFEKRKAKVCVGCILKANGEHHYWSGGTWYRINKRGNKI